MHGGSECRERKYMRLLDWQRHCKLLNITWNLPCQTSFSALFEHHIFLLIEFNLRIMTCGRLKLTIVLKDISVHDSCHL